MAFSLSDLLNPAPALGVATPTHESELSKSSQPKLRTLADFAKDVNASPPLSSTNYSSFAPELFEASDTTMSGTDLAAMAADATNALETSTLAFEQGNPVATVAPALLKQETTEEISTYPVEGLERTETREEPTPDADDSPQKHKEKKYKKRTDLMKDGPERSHIHSSKNEGQHTDKRYLCYICNKLFTRRRSVRDHINKIHNVKTWEPQRSLEITVDPLSGEPVEPIEDTIARGPVPVSENSTKKDKPPKLDVPETIEQEANGEDIPLSLLRQEVSNAESDTLVAKPEVKTESLAGDEETVKSPVDEPKQPVAAVAGKKRPMPETVKPLPAAATKKGIARKPPSNKKAKLSHTESVSDKGTPFRSPSATPAAVYRAPTSKLKNQTNASSVASSPTQSRAGTEEPGSPTYSASGTSASSNDDGEVFCICRKGDNHTWMIACDGGCDEWFHGNCVEIKERDGDLIDKYICPRCTRTGLQTTWKRMCRRKGCRKPAKVFADPPSKYCGKECGRMFFVELIRRGDPYVDTLKNDQFVADGKRQKKMRKKRKVEQAVKKPPKSIMPLVLGDATEIDSESRLATPAESEDERSAYETDTSADEDDLPNRGGPLRAGEVRAIMDKCKTIEAWRDLGRRPETPPGEGDEMGLDAVIEYDDFETAKLAEMQAEKQKLEQSLKTLEAKEKFMDLVKARSASIQESVKKEDKKTKDPCGFDPRFAWSEAVFLAWYEKGGKDLIDTGKVGPPEDDEILLNPRQVNGDTKLVNGVNHDDDNEDDNDEGDDEEDKMPKKGGVCIKNRCPRHKNWAKAQLAEIRFEQDLIRRGIRRCDTVIAGMRDRGVVRAWERKGEA